MDGHRCVRCGIYWASQSGPPERFVFITALCPGCLDQHMKGKAAAR